jgi:hypothetical protein
MPHMYAELLLSLPHHWAPSWDVDLKAVDWFTLAIAIGTVGSAVILGVTAVVARGALADAQRTRHAELLVSLENRWTSAAITRSFHTMARYTDEEVAELVERLYGENDYQPTDAELVDNESLTASANFIESIGVLWDDKALTTEVIYKAWGGPIIEAWAAWRLGVPVMRRVTNEGADLYRYFERLAREMRKMAAASASASGHPASQADAQAGRRRSGQSSSCLQSSEGVPGSSPDVLLGALIALGALSALGWVLKRFFSSN